MRRSILVSLAAAVFAVVSLGALAAPASATAIDPYPSSDPVTSCYGGNRPGTVEFRDMISQRIGGWGGIYVCKYIQGSDPPKLSDHSDGRAFDWMMSAYNSSDVAKVNAVLSWLTRTDENGNRHAMARRLGLRYIIWNHREISFSSASAVWRDHDGPNPHTDHVHFSFSLAGGNQQTTWYTTNPKPASWYPSPTPTGSVFHQVLKANGTWTGFGALNGNNVSHITDVTDRDGNIRALAVSGGQIYQSQGNYVSGVWSPWSLLPSTANVTALSAAMDTGRNRAHVVAVVGGQIYRSIGFFGAEIWSAWTPVPNSANVTAISAALDSSGDRLHVLAVVGGVVYESVEDVVAGTWSPWVQVPNSANVTALTAATLGNQIHLLAVVNGQIYRNTGNLSNGLWSPSWTAVPNTANVTALAATMRPASNQLHILAVVGGNAHHAVGDFNAGTWSPWGGLTSGGTTAAVATTTSPNGDVQVTAVY